MMVSSTKMGKNRGMAGSIIGEAFGGKKNEGQVRIDHCWDRQFFLERVSFLGFISNLGGDRDCLSLGKRKTMNNGGNGQSRKRGKNRDHLKVQGGGKSPPKRTLRQRKIHNSIDPNLVISGKKSQFTTPIKEGGLGKLKTLDSFRRARGRHPKAQDRGR